MNQKKQAPAVIITGCGRKRVGFHVAKHLLGCGYSVAAVYRSNKDRAEEVAKELRLSIPTGNQSNAPDVKLFACDISDENSVAKLVENVWEDFSEVAGLVNTASVWKNIRLEDISHQDLMDHISVDLVGTFHCNRKVGLRMAQQQSGGCIVNFGDWAESRPYPDHAAYFAAKGSIPTLTRCMARELGSRNPKVRVHCIMPGPVLLPEGSSEDRKNFLIQSTLVQQVDRPDSVGMAVEHFLKNDFLTGTCLPVDGGRTIYSSGELE